MSLQPFVSQKKEALSRFNGLLERHLVDIRHPSVGIGQANAVAPLLEVDIEGDGGGSCPVARVCRETGDMLSIDLKVHIAVLAAEVGDGQMANASLLNVDIIPLDVIVSTSSEPTSFVTSTAIVGSREDAGLLSLIVPNLLIGRQVSGLCLVDSALETLLTLGTEILVP